MKSNNHAFCLPGARIDRRRTGFGVYGADGHVLPDTGINTASWLSQPAPATKATPPGDAPRLFGPVLFAGGVDKQFGFVLLNSLGRLWALDGLPPETTIVFAAKPVARVGNYGFVPVILRALGLNNPVMVTEGAAWFEQFYTAAELFGEARGGVGTADFYGWLDSRWPAAGRPDPARKIYVTRSNLGPQAGRYACEDHLETLLRAEGYEIYAPEAHPVRHQVETFQSAGKLIFAEGSALHLFALVRRPGQVSAVVLRRATLPAVMAAQMADRAGTATVAVNAVRELWWPPQRGEHLGLSVIDFGQLEAGLRATGLVSGAGWTAPTKAEVAASLAAGLQPGETVMDAATRAAWLKEQRENRQR